MVKRKKPEELQKANRVMKEKRIEQAVNAILDGKRTQTIVVALMEQYGIAEKTAYQYALEAGKRITQKTSENIDEKISKHRERLERLYARQVEGKDLRGARQTLKDIADLDGLDAPKRTDITTGGMPVQALVKFVGDDDDADEDASATNTTG